LQKDKDITSFNQSRIAEYTAKYTEVGTSILEMKKKHQAKTPSRNGLKEYDDSYTKNSLKKELASLNSQFAQEIKNTQQEKHKIQAEISQAKKALKGINLVSIHICFKIIVKDNNGKSNKRSYANIKECK